MKCKEKEDEIELRRLRTENSLLRQRIDFLETESSDLADRSAVQCALAIITSSVLVL